MTGLIVAAYLTRGRRAVLNWGATGWEVDALLPGDELLEDFNGSSTRAIDIDAPAEAVWPWLVQIGPRPRGGAYTYDWIENLLGLDFQSVDHVIPEFQHPAVGDTVPFGSNRMRFELVDPGRTLVLGSADVDWIWSFNLIEDSGTRLISRNRFRLPGIPARLGMLLLEPASLVMERRMLLGIKQRAERLHRQSSG